MTDLEKVERLRERVNVSFAEAKEALDASDGDILDALIFLENQGKSTIPAGGGYYSEVGGHYSDANRPGKGRHSAQGGDSGAANNGESFGDMLKRFGRFCMMLLRKGNSNFLEARKAGRLMFTCPVTIVVAFILFFFWITIPLFIFSLFFGFRYSFRGSDLGRDSVNRMMDSASELVDDVKKTFVNKTRNNGDDSDFYSADNDDGADSAENTNE